MHCTATDIGNELSGSAQQCFLQNNRPTGSVTEIGGGFNIKGIGDQPDFIAAFFYIAEQSKSQSFPWDVEPYRSNLLTLSCTSFSEMKKKTNLSHLFEGLL